MHTLEQLRSGALAGTRRLDLSCGLQTVPPEVFDLGDTLEVLNLSGNQLTSLPHDLSRLRQLRVIFGSNNPFTELPEVLGDCAALEVVGFKACRIARLSDAALPPKLRWLTLTDNTIAELPAAAGDRPALQKLLLAGNQLQALPESLAQAHRLELLRLSANRLTTLPPWLLTLPSLSWLALSGNPLGWSDRPHCALPQMPWSDLRMDQLLGEGASGHIYRVTHSAHPEGLALKLFKGAITSDGLPEHELATCTAAGAHSSLCTPVATLSGHPQGTTGLLLPLLSPVYVNLASPPSLESCTRDVYAPALRLDAHTALRVAYQVADAVAHLHRRGVVHGDLYAHNILWNRGTSKAMLTDFGAATLLPAESHPAHGALKALEVRAMGCLLEELAALVEPAGRPQPTLSALASTCMDPLPAQRPTMDHLAAQLQAMLLASA